MEIRPIRPEETEAVLPGLSEMLVEAVAEGAGVSFVPPLDPAVATEFWKGSLALAATGQRIVFGAFDGPGDGARPVGTVTLDLATPPNQPHRADVAKMMVATSHRRRGLARALMERLVAETRARGRTLLTLDTVHGGGAEVLYRALGFRPCGVIPFYAKNAGGGHDATALYFLNLEPAQDSFVHGGYSVVPARDGDSPEAAALIERIWTGYPGGRMVLDEEPDLKALASAYAAKDGAFWVVRDAGRKLVGTVGIAPTPHATGMVLHRLYVAPEIRRQGLATRLLAHAEARARARGAGFMEFWSDTRFAEAHAFYARHGYAQLDGERALRDASDSYEYHYRKLL